MNAGGFRPLDQRLYALDALRAIMMLLGIFLHAAMNYVDDYTNLVWLFDDPQASSPLARALFDYIHMFRMPIFFVMAGLFSALLVEKRRRAGFLKNRSQRILLPFIVGLFVLYPLTIASFAFSNGVLRGGIGGGGEQFFAAITTGVTYVPEITMHLWFLYFLILFYPVFVSVSAAARKYFPSINKIVSTGFRKTWQNHIVRLIIPVGFLTLCLFHMDGFLRTSVAFVPEPLTLLTYGFFFWCGWMLFHQRELLLVFNSHAWLHTLTGLALFGAYKARSGFLYGLDLNAQTLVASFLIASVCWLSVLGLTGLFQRYLDRPSSILRYIVDASYWVYLIHLPAIAFLVGIMYWVGGDWWLKYIFLLLSTLIIGGVSYDLFVRNSLLGVVLNGRKYRRGLPAI